LKKRNLISLIIITFSLTITTSFSSVFATEHSEDSVESEWTLMIYFAADNDLENDVEDLLSTLEEIDNTEEGLKIIVMVDKLTSAGAWIYEIVENNRILIQEFSEKNTADSLVLEEFVHYCIENYPSEKTMLSIKDHGYGWRGICLDETSDSQVMNTNDFANALRGKGIDLLLLDGATMASIEVAYELRNIVSYMIASETTLPSAGLPYDIFISNLADHPEISVVDYAKEIVDEFSNEFALQDGASISVTDMLNIDLVGDTFNKITQALVDNMKKYRNIVAQSRDHSLVDPQGSVLCTNFMVDGYKFFDELLSIPDSDLQLAIQEFEQNFNNSLIAEWHSHQFRDIPHGLTLWFPPTINKYQSDGATLNGQIFYENCSLDMVSDSFWEHCLMDYYGMLPESFNLTSDADCPDNDGDFTLYWTSSLRADTYSIFRHNGLIIKLNESVMLIESKLTNNSYKIENMENGTYYYAIAACNEYIDRLSNCEEIFVQLPPNENIDNDEEPLDAFGLYLVTFIVIGTLSIGGISLILYRRVKIKR
jgi:hypothetical protein